MRKPKRSPRHWRSQRRSQHPSCFRRFCHPSRQRSPPRPNRHSTLYLHRNTSNFAPPPARSPTCREQWTFSRGLTRPWKKPILSRKMGPMRMCWKLDCCRLRWRGRLFRRRRTSDIYSWMLAYKQEVDCHYPLPVLTSGGPLYTPPCYVQASTVRIVGPLTEFERQTIIHLIQCVLRGLRSAAFPTLLCMSSAANSRLQSVKR